MAKENLADPQGFQQRAPLRHIAFIMDGNGRWAKKRLLPRSAGHKAGVDRIHEVIDCAFEDYGIYAATLFCFSTENWNRPQKEIDTLFRLLNEFFKKEIDYFMKKGTRINVLGNLEDPRIPEDVRKTIQESTEETKNNTKHVFNVLFNYGGRYDILQSTRRISEEVKEGKLDPSAIDEKVFSSHLLTGELSDIDCLIRTSGEERISNCCLYQVAYAELIFTPTYWPSFDKKELAKCLYEYEHRNRRFGAIKE
ncbi:MAG: polyprenyl diphosphate synthase [Eubacteriales bacterium]|jgi:undecaprenyl diphosphate synthase|nr:polyprenyl diphosphate synthase [Eubacteriales bacterium]